MLRFVRRGVGEGSGGDESQQTNFAPDSFGIAFEPFENSRKLLGEMLILLNFCGGVCGALFSSGFCSRGVQRPSRCIIASRPCLSWTMYGIVYGAPPVFTKAGHVAFLSVSLGDGGHYHGASGGYNAVKVPCSVFGERVDERRKSMF